MYKSFQEQLAEVAELLFTRKNSQTAKESITTVTVDQKCSLDFPPLVPPPVLNHPVEITDKHWAGYNCPYDSMWYELRCGGFTPLDEYGVASKKIASINIFNFHLLAVSKVMNEILGCVMEGRVDYPSVVTAGKVYAYLESCMLDIEAFQDTKKRNEIVIGALNTFRRCSTLHDVNKNSQLTSESTIRNLLYIEDNDWTIHSVARYRKGTWYFPLVPAKLYANPKFAIRNWDFLL